MLHRLFRCRRSLRALPPIRYHQRSVIGLVSLAALGLHGVCGAGSPGPAQAQGRRSPAPAPSRVEIYDPDPQTCQAERIRQAFQRQLHPFADQSPAVLARLRQVQWEMTASSLRRCVDKGLMTPEQATALQQELQAQPPVSTRP